MSATLHTGDALTVLRSLPAGLARCCVTSPPYFGLRDYGVVGQLGLEPTPDAYVARMVEVFREVRRVLADDGTLWLNLGDSYVSVAGAGSQGTNGEMAGRSVVRARAQVRDGKAVHGSVKRPPSVDGLAPKQLLGIPWRVAFALQADGWWLRSDIVWHKPNPMPESVRDRPTKAHEYVFLLSKAERYYYNAAAIAEPATHAGRIVLASDAATAKNGAKGTHGATAFGFTQHDTLVKPDRNARSVWTIATQPYPEAHFATFPEELPSRCIRAGSAPGDTVLDPFGGSGTTGAVAVGLGRAAVLIELNPAYVALARHRIGPMLCDEPAALLATGEG